MSYNIHKILCREINKLEQDTQQRIETLRWLAEQVLKQNLEQNQKQPKPIEMKHEAEGRFCPECGDTMTNAHSNYAPTWSDAHDNIVCWHCSLRAPSKTRK
jgi:NADH pyrophosphatase NudC (nudix superfamily)